jgi:single-strand DNA-binding protein
MLEAAASGVLAMPIELKTSRAGKPYANLSLAIDAGQDEHGKPLTTWLRCAVFGEVAELLARTAQKGCKIYCEGALSLNTWTGNDGAQKTGLSMACWKAMKIGASAIGKNRRQFKEKGHAVASESQAARQLRATSFAVESAPERYQRERPRVVGRDDFDDSLDDLPFLGRAR